MTSLFTRHNLKQEIGQEAFKEFLNYFVNNLSSQQYPQNKDYIALLSTRFNLKQDLGENEFNQLINSLSLNDEFLVQALTKQFCIFEDFADEFNSLSREEQQGFCNWLNNILTQKGITQADKQDFSLYFPRVMRARIQAGITSAQAA